MSSPRPRVSLIIFPSESPPPIPITPIRRCRNRARTRPWESLTWPLTSTDDLPAPNPAKYRFARLPGSIVTNVPSTTSA